MTHHVGRIAVAVAVAAVAVVGPVAAGQTPPAPVLTPVDEAVADISPLQISLFDQRVDAGPASAFERVYQTDALPGRYARIDGAVWAVFPRSAYVATQDDGLVAIVPENTVFYIGGPPASMLAPAPLPVPPSDRWINGRVSAYVGPVVRDTRIDGRWRAPAPPPPTADAASRPTVWSSPAYRRSRMRALLARVGER